MALWDDTVFTGQVMISNEMASRRHVLAVWLYDSPSISLKGGYAPCTTCHTQHQSQAASVM